MRFLIIFCTLLLTTNLFASEQEWRHSFFAKTYTLNGKGDTGPVTKQEFKTLLKKIKKTYTKTIHHRGGLFKIKAKWKSNRVNAYASRLGPIWKLTALGGLARHPMITYDGFAIVLCHEMGHHLGGAPKSKVYFKRWVSFEGQADYFATLKCFRTLFKDDDNVSYLKEHYSIIDPWAQEKCSAIYKSDNRIALCIRSIMAGQVIANLIADYHDVPFPQLSTPDMSIVEETDYRHPKVQCRLDTYAQAALCPIEDTVELDNENYVIGSCTRLDDYTLGARPLCWFAP
jgi:hypothetical protein